MRKIFITVFAGLVAFGCSGCPFWNHGPSHAGIVIRSYAMPFTMESIDCRYRIDGGDTVRFMEEHRDVENRVFCIERGISDNSQKSFQPVLLFTTNDSIYSIELIDSPLEDVFLEYRGEIRRDWNSADGRMPNMVPLGHITGNDLDSLGYYVTYTQ